MLRQRRNLERANRDLVVFHGGEGTRLATQLDLRSIVQIDHKRVINLYEHFVKDDSIA